MMTINEFDECTQKLRSSSMFYMSLGSKELFHSNFLQWLSVTDWKFFIKIMHTLSNQKDKSKKSNKKKIGKIFFL